MGKGKCLISYEPNELSKAHQGTMLIKSGRGKKMTKAKYLISYLLMGE